MLNRGDKMEKYDKGGFYELSLELTEGQLEQALERLHTDKVVGIAHFTGDYVELQGQLRVAEGRVPCVVTAMQSEGETSWLTLSVSPKVLRRTGSAAINEAFITVAKQLNPFLLGLIGEEVNGITSHEDVNVEEFPNIIILLKDAQQKRGFQIYGQ